MVSFYLIKKVLMKLDHLHLKIHLFTLPEPYTSTFFFEFTFAL